MSEDLNGDDDRGVQTLRSLVRGDRYQLILLAVLEVQTLSGIHHPGHRVHLKLTSDVTSLPVNTIADLSVLSAVRVRGQYAQYGRADRGVLSDGCRVGRAVENRSIIVVVGDRNVDGYETGSGRKSAVDGRYHEPVCGRGFVIQRSGYGEFQTSAGTCSRHQAEHVVFVAGLDEVALKYGNPLSHTMNDYSINDITNLKYK